MKRTDGGNVVLTKKRSRNMSDSDDKAGEEEAAVAVRDWFHSWKAAVAARDWFHSWKASSSALLTENKALLFKGSSL